MEEELPKSRVKAVKTKWGSAIGESVASLSTLLVEETSRVRSTSIRSTIANG
jgi:hypothetical protein